MENNAQIQNKYRWVYLVGFFLILSLPLLVLPPWFTPIGWGKTIVFRIILSILFFLFIGQVLFKGISPLYIKDKIKTVSLAFWLLFALFGIYLLATIFSLDPHFSLWGDPYRSGGFVNFSFYIIFAVITFLIVRQKDWQKIWDFSIIIGILVSLVAIFQQFAIFSKFLIPFEFRPGSTMGNPIFLAIYLLLLIFLILSFGIKSKNRAKKAFYFFSLLLFLFVVIILTQTRAALAGLAIGSLWFLFAYPKKMKSFKISAGILLILGIFGMYFLNAHFDILKNQPFIIRSAIGRMLSLVEGAKIGESRISNWKVSLQALKDRPILGYGPENFMIGFDKYYDPKLPRLAQGPEGGAEWWDRAHNFIFDISITAGIPALIIYLSLFGILFWQLQKVKRKQLETAVICHGIQATFIGYLVANLFSFDTFSTYLIFFLLIGYSLFLMSSYSESTATNKKSGKAVFKILYKYNKIIISVLFIFLVWFIWSFNLKPLRITKELNLAIFYSEHGKCGQALEEIEDIALPRSIIENYLRLGCVSIIRNCTDEKIKPTEEFAKEAIQLLEKNIKTGPHYVRNWLLLAEYTNILIEEKIKLTDNIFTDTKEMEELKNEANYYFERAYSLSPKRQEIFKEWLKTGLITGDYERAKENAQKCIDLNPNYGVCYWLMALTQGYLGNFEELSSFAALAREKGYNIESEESLPQLINMYIRTENYQGLVETYPKLISITSDNTKKAQLHASLAVVYKELGEIEKARKEALKALELQPEAKEIVEEFLRTLEK